MQQIKENIKEPSTVFTATCVLLLIIITLFGLYSMKQVKKYDTDKYKTTKKNKRQTKPHDLPRLLHTAPFNNNFSYSV